MSTDANPPTLDPPTPVITDHARERWIKRICSRQDGVAPWDLAPSFVEAVSVGVPRNNGHGRLHPPTGAVFIYVPDHEDWIVITVLDAHRHRVTIVDDHLKTCDKCGYRYNAGRGPCPWDHSDHDHDRNNGNGNGNRRDD